MAEKKVITNHKIKSAMHVCYARCVNEQFSKGDPGFCFITFLFLLYQSNYID